MEECTLAKSLRQRTSWIIILTEREREREEREQKSLWWKDLLSDRNVVITQLSLVTFHNTEGNSKRIKKVHVVL